MIFFFIGQEDLHFADSKFMPKQETKNFFHTFSQKNDHFVDGVKMMNDGRIALLSCPRLDCGLYRCPRSLVLTE
jgi:hypothetical protein